MKKLAMIVAFALAEQFAVMGLFLWLFLPLGGTHPNTSFNVQGWSAEVVENDDIAWNFMQDCDPNHSHIAASVRGWVSRQ